MRVILIDDEKAMHLIMRKMLMKLEQVEIVGMFQDTAAAESFLDTHEADLAFVDISMPHESGIAFAKRMGELQSRLHIVFVTSHQDYALDAFNVFALDYIVKPVAMNRLEKTVSRAASLLRPSTASPAAGAEGAPGDPPQNDVRVYGLGGIEIRGGTAGMLKLTSRKSAELFAYLLMHAGRMVSRSRLTSDMYGGMPQKNAETYLNTTAYQLRKALKPIGNFMNVISDNDGYSLEMKGGVQLDYEEFERGVQKLGAVDEANLDRALAMEALYVGGLFGDRGYVWAIGYIERLSKLHAALAQQIAAELLRQRMHDQAIRLMDKRLSFDPLDDAAMSMLMQAYAAASDKPGLQKRFKRYARLLRTELGIGPSKAMTLLYDRLLASVT